MKITAKLESLVDRFFDEVADRIADRLLVGDEPTVHIENQFIGDDRYTDFERSLMAQRPQERLRDVPFDIMLSDQRDV